MRRDKNLVFKLRKEGKSYRDIQKQVNISRSTLCVWFKNENWSKHIKYNNNKTNISLGTERLKLLNIARDRALKDKYDQIEIEAEENFKIFKNETLFWAGLMLYAGEGDKRSRNQTRITNSEFYIHKIFINFSEKYLKIPKKHIKISLIVYPDNSISECLDLWSKELNISTNNFYKTQIIEGKEKSKRLQYGIGISIISSRVVVKKRMLKWIELSKQEFQS